MRKQDTALLAFVYRIQLAKLMELAKRVGYSITGDTTDLNAYVFVTGIQDGFEGKQVIVYVSRLLLPNSGYNQIEYAKLLMAMDDKLKYLKQCEKISMTGEVMAERDEHPIFRFKNNIPYAAELGIQPWHHLIFVDDLVYVYIWDTRVVDKVLTIQETIGLSKRMFKAPFDNNAKLVFTEQTAWAKDKFEQFLPAVHPCIRTMTVTEELEEAGYNVEQTNMEDE